MTSPLPPHMRHNREGQPCFHDYYHGLTCEDYEALRARANGCCEICGVHEEATRRGFLVVDHFHGTPDIAGISFVRGMLCDRCNGGVMACIDGNKAWGANRKWEAKAREYEANSWERPSAIALRQMAARTEMPLAAATPKSRWPKPRPSWQTCPPQLTVPLRTGMVVVAKKLRRNLTQRQLSRLIELLSESTDAER